MGLVPLQGLFATAFAWRRAEPKPGAAPRSRCHGGEPSFNRLRPGLHSELCLPGAAASLLEFITLTRPPTEVVTAAQATLVESVRKLKS